MEEENVKVEAKAEKAKPAKTKKKSKLALIISLVVVGVIVLAGIGFAIWYFAYYNSDNKVLEDAFYSTFSNTEGTSQMKITASVGGDTNMNVEANMKASYNKNEAAIDIDGKFSSGDMSASASANLVTDKDNNVYIRVNDLGKTLSSVGLTGYDVSSVSDKWIKISSSEIKNILSQSGVSVDSSSSQDCVSKISGALTSGKTAQKEILDAIKDSKILSAKRVGSDKDGIKYELSGSVSNAKAFTNKLSGTQVYKAITDCAGVASTDESSLSSLFGSDFNLDQAVSQIEQLKSQVSINTYFWVKGWGHEPTRLLVNVKMNQQNAEFTLDMTREISTPKITIPSDTTSLTEIISSLMSND